MKIPAQILKEIVVKNGFVNEAEYTQAEKAAQELGKEISDILIFRGAVSEEALGKLVAEYLKVPFADLKTKIIPSETLNTIPEKLARKYQIVPLKVEGDKLYLAMQDPQDLEALEFAKRQSGLEIVPYYAVSKDIRNGLAQYKRNIRQEFNDIITKHVEEAKVSDKGDKDLTSTAAELPVIKILNTLLEYAHAERASDIHIETLENEILIRFRVDGVLRDIINLPRKIQPAIIARIKILSSLKIDEHRIPQDGRFKFQIDLQFIALRVSVIPGFYAENIVLRLLAESARPKSLEELGLSHKNLSLVKKSITEPHGMILVTGPTGSGKTTTLYSILNILNTSKVKICTIEDPIEYGITRVSQIQVNKQTGLSFAKGLRSLLRHDPDIIMVGEIRDEETANIAIHSALTGHLVLSTLHTNDAPSTIPRFLDMGAEGYLVSSTINVIIAQRLVRKICQTCISEYQPPKEIIQSLANQLGTQQLNQKFYQGKGCEECGHSGYKGRIGIYEVLNIDDKVRDLTIKHSPAEAIRKVAISAGMTTILQDGVDKISSGITTLEEVLRVVRE